MRRHFPLLGLAGLACNTRPTGPATQPVDAPVRAAQTVQVPLLPPSAAPAPSAEEPAEMRGAVLDRARAKWDFDAARSTRVLYSWTTKEQLEAMRAGGSVLSRSVTPGKGFATFDHALHRASALGDARAQVLWHEGFAKSRFAWSNAFGVAAGMRGERYGDVLLRITLKREAVFDHFSLQSGGILTLSQDARPEHLGAVGFASGKYREYVLPNESMIEKVEAFTPELRDEVEQQRTFLRMVLRDPSHFPPDARSAFFPDVQALVGTVEIQAALDALTAWLDDKTAPFSRAVATSFALGALRPSIAELCKVHGVVEQQRRIASFGLQTLYEPQCAPADACQAITSPTKKYAVCFPVPAFFR